MTEHWSNRPAMQLSYTLDDKLTEAAFGLIVLEADETVEPDFCRLLPGSRYRVYHSRVESADEVTPETLLTMADTIPAAADMLPRPAGLDAVGYCCTSGATMLGEARVAELVGQALPGIPVSNPLTALKAACAALGVRRLAIVSPYVAEVSNAICDRLQDAGIGIAAFGSFESREERIVARIAPDSILDAIVRVGAAGGDAVFASCTNLRATEVLEAAERRIDKPVLTSNQVLAWHMMRLAGVTAPLPRGGALAGCPLPAGDG